MGVVEAAAHFFAEAIFPSIQQEEEVGEIRLRTSVPAVGNVVLDLSPFDRFGGRGGRLKVQTVAVAAENQGDLTFTVLVGSDVLINAGTPSSEAVAEIGPDNETPAIIGFGAPADPITITLFNAHATLARIFFTNVSVENA